MLSVTRYGVVLKYPKAPLLQLKPKARGIFLPIEVVELSRQRLPRSRVNEHVQEFMAQAMIMGPTDRQGYILRKRKNFDGNPVLDHFGLKLSSELVSCKGCVLNSPNIVYRNKVKC